MTETSPIVSLNVPHAFRAGSVGRPLPGVDVAILSDAGQPLPPGEVGEIVVRGHSVMRGYYRKPDATAETLRDGALHTGDMGYLDEDGYIFITGRKKDLIIVGGENVFPREIEAALLEDETVAEVAVVGEPDETRGEVPVAYVILAEGATATDNQLRDQCRQRLASYKVPRRIYFVTDLPRSPTGKILKRELKPTLAS
jgi:long-chain acyl-CoA synthetase